MNVVPLNLPPLRERLEDMAELVPALVGLANASMPAKTFTNSAISAMAQYS